VCMLAALSLTAAADFVYEGLFAEYDVLTPAEIGFSFEGETGCTAMPQSGGTLACLIDGEHLANPTHFSDKGIVLVRNDFVKPGYEENMSQAIQPLDAIPTFSFTLTYEDEVTFDAVYLSLFYMAFDCVCAPGEHKVIVETSEDGNLWIPVGEDGSFYFRDNQPLYSDVKDPYSEEIVVPLGEEVTAQYVRLSFKFKELEAADDYWGYYTNVYEWCGYTELGVALYADGEEPVPMTKEEAEAPDLVLEGLWYMEETDTTTVFDFTTPGVMKAIGYEAADFAENGMDAVAQATVEFPYVAEAEYIVVDMDGTTVVFYVTFADDSIELDDGNEAILLEEYVPKAPEVSEEESSRPAESSEEEVSEEESEEETSVETSVPAVSAPVESSAVSPAEEGDSTLLIVIIAVVAVVIIGAVVFIVIKRKK
ncbi:MAG: hypothetical protein IKT91_00715, partial [Clostridia bacterium]|nr:hypothetical protein [Clostridia bacterium]